MEAQLWACDHVVIGQTQSPRHSPLNTCGPLLDCADCLHQKGTVTAAGAPCVPTEATPPFCLDVAAWSCSLHCPPSPSLVGQNITGADFSVSSCIHGAPHKRVSGCYVPWAIDRDWPQLLVAQHR